jgi:DNA mismatch endonuclease (patch repair protein)
MQANRRRDTHPEIAVRRLLHARGLRYRVDTRPIPAFRHTADIVFTKARLAVFIDGCWWHGCPEHHRPPRRNSDYWHAKIEGNRDRDRRVTDQLESAGWRVVRVWEHQDPAEVAAQIEHLVRPGRPSAG